jgi:hypothetical protein
MMRSRIAVARAALALLLVSGGAAGCAISRNDRVTIGDEEHGAAVLEALAPSDATPIVGEPVGPAQRQVSPSVLDVDRTNWGATELLVPVDGTWHRRELSTHLDFTNATARQRNEFPTAENALELWGDLDAQTQEGLLALPYSILDAILIVPRAFYQHPWITRSPNVPYERNPWPATRWSSGLENAGPVRPATHHRGKDDSNE